MQKCLQKWKKMKSLTSKRDKKSLELSMRSSWVRKTDTRACEFIRACANILHQTHSAMCAKDSISFDFFFFKKMILPFLLPTGKWEAHQSLIRYRSQPCAHKQAQTQTHGRLCISNSWPYTLQSESQQRFPCFMSAWHQPQNGEEWGKSVTELAWSQNY